MPPPGSPQFTGRVLKRRLRLPLAFEAVAPIPAHRCTAFLSKYGEGGTKLAAETEFEYSRESGPAKAAVSGTGLVVAWSETIGVVLQTCDRTMNGRLIFEKISGRRAFPPAVFWGRGRAGARPLFHDHLRRHLGMEGAEI